MSELASLKKEAAKLYKKAQNFGDLSCGRNLAEHIRPGLYEARQKFNQVWERIQELDPSAPVNPFL